MFSVDINALKARTIASHSGSNEKMGRDGSEFGGGTKSDGVSMSMTLMIKD